MYAITAKKKHQVQNHNRLTSQDADVPNLNDYQRGGDHAVKYRSRLIGNNHAILASSASSSFHSFREPNLNTQI